MAATGEFDFEAYTPARMAHLAETAGVVKARLALGPLLALGILAGAFIALGALFYMVAVTGSALGFGPTRLIGGAAFSLGLVLVVIAGAELFTGNNLIVMAWAHRRVTTAALLRNWLVVYIGNMIGALGIAAMVALGEIATGPVGETATAIAAGKTALSPLAAFFRAVLCNILVCLAVWLCFAARRVTGKVLVIAFPITAFVAIGLEHSIANMFFLPLGLYLADAPIVAPTLANLLPVTLGNIVGGAGFVAGTYWFCYLRGDDRAKKTV